MEKIHGLMPRIGGRDYSIPVSRDYALIIPCEFTDCPINSSKHCSMPSSIKINSGGKCQTGFDLWQEKLKMKQEKLKKNKKDSGFYTHEGD